MDINNVQNLLLYNLQKDMLSSAMSQSSSGESEICFEIMKQALLESTEDNVSTLSQGAVASNGNNNLLLDQLPVITKQTEQLFNITRPDETNSVTESSNLTESVTESSNLTEYEVIYNTVEKYSKELDIDKDLILSIIKQESNFNPKVTSSAGAKGLMQLMDFNSETYGVSDPYNIEENIKGGTRLLKDYLNMYDNDVEMALMAYNGGPGTMERRGVTSAEDLYKMPEETQNYVPKVLNYYKNKSY
ncbi:lytic transglycosylase domain-containing protein [Clostridium sp.]|uniref:lytic transglycosylase domain-containing protein n=1 Tax=Clostridium sp. TaxID=1506 RepID=UPI001B4B6854|nr:lytic transglycosylase domain-containing protein [Clostridium sp.]MBP3917396.1 lytic transglycosylase domain-containing protein [Clostridium sp.]